MPLKHEGKKSQLLSALRKLEELEQALEAKRKQNEEYTVRKWCVGELQQPLRHT
jgi:hypothetical protein